MINFETFAVQFVKQVDIQEQVEIQKQIDIDVFVQGNKAEAFGPNSHTETLALTQAVEGIGSSSISEALSAT